MSLPLGAGRLTRDRLPGDPPGARRARAAQVDPGNDRERGAAVSKAPRPDRTIPTVQDDALARADRRRRSAQRGAVFRGRARRGDLGRRRAAAVATTIAERVSLPGVSAARAQQMLAGALVAEAAMDLLGVDRLDICPWALREGMILRRLDSMG